ncbi:MAG: M48 family metalloprotease [Chloroflexi bacterium]|nr:M48 family metalloprotease [Chloroflexota bacterium]
MTDDQAPTPKPFPADPRLRERRPGPTQPLPVPPGPTSPGSIPPPPQSRAEAGAGPRAWGQVAGPADRTSFFAEQARHRRATWRLSVASSLSVVLAGLPLSLVVTPIVFLAAILLAKLISLVGLLPANVPESFRFVAWTIGRLMDAIDVADKGPIPPLLLFQAGLGVVSLLLPGVLVMLVFWLLLRRLFSGAGVGGLVLGLGARHPNPGDLEERQLVNVVEEMAIAAGLPAPRVMLLDGQIANAAVVGSSPADAVIVVSRRLLDEMDRDETQGVLAQLVASIGNGDLGVALSMVTVFRTFGLVNVLLDAPISTSARATLWQLFRVLTDKAGREADARAAEAARLLGSRVSMVEMEDVDLVLGSEEQKSRAPRGIRGLLLKVRIFGLFPIWAAAGLAKTALMMMVLGLLSPMLAWTWRTRRFLADATAVQLTRNPDGIARGLQGLLARGGGIRGGAWADHLFVVGGAVTDRHRVNQEVVQELQAEVERESVGKSGAERVAARLRAGHKYRQRLEAEADQTTPDESEIGQLGWLSMHPPLASRLKRLQKMGAHVDPEAFEGSWTSKLQLVMLAIFSPLFLLIAFLMGVVVVLCTGLILVFMMIPMAIVYAIFEWLF